MSALSEKDQMKKKVGEYAATFVQPGTVIGVGTGTTAYWMILALGAKVKEGFDIKAVPTSKQTEDLARAQGIPLTTLNDVEELALTIDGADEVDTDNWHLIKGGGGALLQEKMVAAASKRMLVIADEQKLVEKLGKFPLPVEVIPFGYKQVERKVKAMGCPEVVVRSKSDGSPYITDHGNYILDCHFGVIEDAQWLGESLHDIPGVVEHGLFLGLATDVLVGYSDGRVGELKR